MSIATGIFSKPAAVGQQTISGIGFNGSGGALILSCMGNTVDGTWADPIRFAYGISDGTRSYCVANGIDDNVTPANTYQYHAEVALVIIDGSGTILGRCTFTEWTNDTFVLTWDIANATAYLISYMVIAGEGLETYVNTGQIIDNGNLAVTGSEITADLLIVLSPGLITAPASGGVTARFNIGATDGTNLWSHNWKSVDGGAASGALHDTTNTKVIQHNDAIFNNPSASVSFVSFEADGYILSVDAHTQDYRFGSLEIAGLNNVLVGNHANAVGVGIQTITVNFEPDGVLNVGSGPALVSPRVVDIYSTFGFVGAVGSDAGGSINDDDGANPTTTKALLETGQAWFKAQNVTETVQSEGNLSSYTATTYKINWTIQDGTIIPNYFYIAFGTPAVIPPSPGAIFKLEDGDGVLTNICEYLTSVDITFNRDISELHLLCGAGIARVPGKQSGEISITGGYSTIVDRVIFSSFQLNEPVDWEYYPRGDAGATHYSGECVVKIYKPGPVDAGSHVPISATLLIDGNITRSS
jgi:hypothetical protein